MGANLPGVEHSNTCLHYCFTYGYADLGDYLISKGANDALKNKQGLTCYEGLDQVRLPAHLFICLIPICTLYSFPDFLPHIYEMWFFDCCLERSFLARHPVCTFH